MGNFVNIGLIAEIKNFKQRVIVFLDNLEGFSFESIIFPKDKDYFEWIVYDRTECNIDEAIDYCIKDEAAEFKGSFMIMGYSLNCISFQIENYSEEEKCLIIKIPGDNPLFDNINLAEKIIIELLKKVSGFNYGFCDSEASVIDEKYSIFVNYFPKLEVRYEQWKIDGLTSR